MVAVDERLRRELPFRAVRRGLGPRLPVSGGFWVKEVILTPEGFEQLKGELDHLRTDKRREIAQRIAAAREFGEIAENAEYDDAKNEQMMLEHRIQQLEERLADAR